MKTTLILVMLLAAATTYRIHLIDEQLSFMVARQEIQKQRAALLERGLAAVWFREQLIETSLKRSQQ